MTARFRQDVFSSRSLCFCMLQTVIDLVCYIVSEYFVDSKIVRFTFVKRSCTQVLSGIFLHPSISCMHVLCLRVEPRFQEISEDLVEYPPSAIQTKISEDLCLTLLLYFSYDTVSVKVSSQLSFSCICPETLNVGAIYTPTSFE